MAISAPVQHLLIRQGLPLADENWSGRVWSSSVRCNTFFVLRPEAINLDGQSLSTVPGNKRMSYFSAYPLLRNIVLRTEPARFITAGSCAARCWKKELIAASRQLCVRTLLCVVLQLIEE